MSEASPDVLLETIQDLDQLLQDPSPVLIFKHSTACPVSARAHGEFVSWLARKGAVPRTALVRVIEERPISLALADRLDVTHQSPQAILVVDGKAVWNASHGWINVESLDANASGGGQASE